MRLGSPYLLLIICLSIWVSSQQTILSDETYSIYKNQKLVDVKNQVINVNAGNTVTLANGQVMTVKNAWTVFAMDFADTYLPKFVTSPTNRVPVSCGACFNSDSCYPLEYSLCSSTQEKTGNYNCYVVPVAVGAWSEIYTLRVENILINTQSADKTKTGQITMNDAAKFSSTISKTVVMTGVLANVPISTMRYFSFSQQKTSTLPAVHPGVYTSTSLQVLANIDPVSITTESAENIDCSVKDTSIGISPQQPTTDTLVHYFTILSEKDGGGNQRLGACANRVFQNIKVLCSDGTIVQLSTSLVTAPLQVYDAINQIWVQVYYTTSGLQILPNPYLTTTSIGLTLTGGGPIDDDNGRFVVCMINNGDAKLQPVSQVIDYTISPNYFSQYTINQVQVDFEPLQVVLKLSENLLMVAVSMPAICHVYLNESTTLTFPFADDYLVDTFDVSDIPYFDESIVYECNGNVGTYAVPSDWIYDEQDYNLPLNVELVFEDNGILAMYMDEFYSCKVEVSSKYTWSFNTKDYYKEDAFNMDNYATSYTSQDDFDYSTGYNDNTWKYSVKISYKPYMPLYSPITYVCNGTAGFIEVDDDLAGWGGVLDPSMVVLATYGVQEAKIGWTWQWIVAVVIMSFFALLIVIRFFYLLIYHGHHNRDMIEIHDHAK